MINKIELLAPAGSSEALHAAVENGADAVYLGGKLFNARQQADNFDIAVLEESLKYAHARGVNIYLTMNTLVSDDELKQALEFAAEARKAGIDGIIVQDIGLAGALSRIMPDVPLHGSTQMTVYDIEGVKALEVMGFKRVVLARELSLQEASEIARNTALEVEVFVHGALCVCYSGQCLMSSIIGGRSGNRGRCAQPCRLPYRLSGGPDAKNKKTMKEQYLLSPKDMCSLGFLNEIAGSGIKSLKIEGRLKSPEYVATVVSTYRKYLDRALLQKDGDLRARLDINASDMHNLLQVYNRGGFSSGYFKGKTGIDMMSFEKPNNSGIYVGSVMAYDRSTQTVRVRLEDKVAVGDGVEIWAGGFNSPGGIISSITKVELGGLKNKGGSRDMSRGKKWGMNKVDIRNMSKVETRDMFMLEVRGSNLKTAEKGDLVTLGSFKGDIVPGMGIYKTLDAELNRTARESYSGRFIKSVPVKGKAVLNTGCPLTLHASDIDGNSVTAIGNIMAESALHKPLTEERLKEQLGKTGSTPMFFSLLEMELEDGLALPVSEINEVRRKALDGLLELRSNKYKDLRKDNGVSSRIDELLNPTSAVPVNSAEPTTISPDKATLTAALVAAEPINTAQDNTALESTVPGSTAPEGTASATQRSLRSKSDTSKKADIALYFYKWNENLDYLKLEANRIYFPAAALDRKGFRDYIHAVKAAGTEVFIWLPSITRGNYSRVSGKLEKEFEQQNDNIYNPDIDGILVGNIGTVKRYDSLRSNLQSQYKEKKFSLAGDISLNLYNSFSVKEAAAMGLDSITLSVELTLQQIRTIINVKPYSPAGSNRPAIEAAVYGRLPLMTSEQCPVGCVEGGFKAGTKCTGPCTNGDYSLVDRMGKEFPVLCDRIDCRSIILNSNVLFTPGSLPDLKAAGVGIFRLYLWDEGQDDIIELVRLHKAAAAGKAPENSEYVGLTEQIKAAGFTKGHYYRGV